LTVSRYRDTVRLVSKTTRPATAAVNPACIPVVLCCRPVHSVEHLIQGWDALDAVRREPARITANVMFARVRLEGARASAGLVGPRKRAAVLAECEELARAIGDVAHLAQVAS
jgi:hypothetical protein